MARPVRLGLIGAGRWGQIYIKTLKSLLGVELTRLCSSNPESAALVGPACEITRDWRALIKADDLDGVIVATPPALHAEMVEAAVVAGVPVMVEKPLTMNLGEALRLQRIIEQSGVTVLVDHIHLFHPGYVALKEKAKNLGSIRFIRSVGGSWGPFRPDVPVLWDYGPHDVALCLDLLGKMPTSVDAARQLARQTNEGYGEILSLQLDFPGSVSAAITIGNIMQGKKRIFVVYFDDYVLVLDDLAEHKLVMHRIKDRSVADLTDQTFAGGTPMQVSADLPLTCVVTAFVTGISGGSRGALGVALGVKVVRVLSDSHSILGAP